MQHVQPDTQAHPANRLRAHRQGGGGGVSQQGPVELGQFVGKNKFRFKNKWVSLDSTVIDLCLSMYDWATFRRTKGAVKLHLVLDHDGYLPCFGIITDGKAADVKATHQMHFAPGTVVVDDRGDNDYRLFAKWTDAGVYFVTRMKDNALFEVVEEYAVPQNRNILKDQTIRLTGVGSQDKCPHLLRRAEAVREDTGGILVFITNHHGLGASTIAAIDKDRWQIELFFKALKQNLKIKTFVGTSATRGQDPDLDSIDLDAAAAHESLHPSRSDGVARSTLRHAASFAGTLGLRLILDSTREHHLENSSSLVQNPHQFSAPLTQGRLFCTAVEFS